MDFLKSNETGIIMDNNIYINGNNLGNIGGSGNISINELNDLQNLTSLLSSIRDIEGDISMEDRKDFNTNIDILSKELTCESPNKSKIEKAWKKIKEIASNEIFKDYILAIGKFVYKVLE